MTNRNTHIPRQDNSRVRYTNVTLVGGLFNGRIVEYFRDDGNGYAWITGIVKGSAKSERYKINPTDHYVANVCNARGEYV
ncbi:hypothetical protein [Vibrio phage LV6]|nr:hypothetical protein [Vibrio phage LV6]